MPTTGAKRPILLYIGDGRAVDWRQIGIDDPRLRMGGIAECLAKQPFGGLRVTQGRKQEINGRNVQKLDRTENNAYGLLVLRSRGSVGR